ncbi:hypothetical protein [Adonisia turfae]|uniref:Uncharacterized protein n=1 Tax=Adonisia turfae CCMR0081 TaxID=2292702 RepID=A0A6M0RDY7_9CYAN|nr:hypothetical protein [Adonisia turfae]NEZ54123.1 hypothetical protein [Adonisia turfae CCMR0081]
MCPNTLDDVYLLRLSELQQTALNRLNLSDDQKNVVQRYHQLATCSILTEKDVLELSGIWQQAEGDTQLTQALTLIDEFQVDSLQGEKLLSEDVNLRSFLSEHIPVLAEEKLKQLQGENRIGIQPQKACIVLLCPDGSGFIQRPIPEDRFINLDDQEICEKCGTKIAKHERFIFVPSDSALPTPT